MRAAGSIKKAAAFLYALLMAATLCLLLFAEKGTDYYLKKDIGAGNLSLIFTGLIIAMLLFAVLFMLKKLLGRIFPGEPDERSVFFLIAVLSFILFAGEVIFIESAFFYSDWDPAAVLDCTYKVLRGAQEEVSLDYFSAHPNNLMIVFIYTLVLRFTGLFNLSSPVMLSVFQAVLFTLTGILVFYIVKDLVSFKTAVFIWIFYAFWIGFNPWILITYSDAVGLIFPVLTLRLFQLLIKHNRILTAFIMGAAAAAGYGVKPQTVIMFIAVLIVLVLSCISSFTRKKAGVILTSLIAFTVMYAVIILAIYPSLGLKLDKEKSFGFSHYIMMGLNNETDGVYSNDDTEFTNSIENPAIRRSENLRVASERVKSYGFKGMARHLMKKQLVNFSDGTFSWGVDGNFFAGTHFPGLSDIKENKLRPHIHSFITVGAAHYLSFCRILQGIWLLVLFFATAYGILWFFRPERRQVKGKNAGEDAETVNLAVMLSLTGLIIFELIFEAKARYLFTYLPIFLVAAGSGACGIWSLLSGRLTSSEELKQEA